MSTFYHQNGGRVTFSRNELDHVDKSYRGRRLFSDEDIDFGRVQVRTKGQRLPPPTWMEMPSKRDPPTSDNSPESEGESQNESDKESKEEEGQTIDS